MTSEPTPIYRHTQIGRTIIWVIGAIMLMDAVLLAVLLAVSRGAAAVVMLPSGAVILILGIVLALFYSLTVTVTPTAITLRFGIGLIRRRFLLADVAGVQRIRTRWWNGWGIHGFPGVGWLYNVSGFDAVELKMHNGMKNAIGTDDPAGLEDAIRRTMR